LALRKRGNVLNATPIYKVVDLFAGPGGLAEGFSNVRDEHGRRRFEIALSVEMEDAAFATLRLRSFVRQFDRNLPDAYYKYVAGEISKSQLISEHPEQWQKAVLETKQLTLGGAGAEEIIDPVLDELRSQPGEIVLIGGPPCQAYSLVGRARNRGVKDYDANSDHRHFLYREYIRIVSRLKPVAFVMENVKGMLSAKVGNKQIFELVLDDLIAAGGSPDSYTLIPMAATEAGKNAGYVLRSEFYGVPQCRHRVILVGIRTDQIRKSDIDSLPFYGLSTCEQRATVADVIADMPKLRSGLSKEIDGEKEWQDAAVGALKLAAKACSNDKALKTVGNRLKKYSAMLEGQKRIPKRTSTLVSKPSNHRLYSWLFDPKLVSLPNNETRGHMTSDLARYGFAACFAEIFGRSPKAEEFPTDLAPAHLNWKTGKFSDRFRVQVWRSPSTTVTSHISKDGHYFIHPDPLQCRSLTVREAARLQTFPDNYLFEGNRTQQFVQVGNAVPPLLAYQIGKVVFDLIRTYQGKGSSCNSDA
jgi:DNA (cytosine-5)-methyltransferase 1